MSRTPLLASILLPVCAACAAAPAPPVQFDGQYTATLSLVVGECSVDSGFDPVDTQMSYALDLDIRQPEDRIGFELALQYSSDDATQDVGGISSVEFKSDVTEFSMGARWYYDDIVRGLVPYIGGGFALDWVSFEASGLGGSSSESDFTPALYAHAGIAWPINSTFSIALDYRMLFFSNVSLGDAGTDIDYQQFGLALGYSF